MLSSSEATGRSEVESQEVVPRTATVLLACIYIYRWGGERAF